MTQQVQIEVPTKRIAELEDENGRLRLQVAELDFEAGGVLSSLRYEREQNENLKRELAEERARLDWLGIHWGRDRLFVHRGDGMVLIYDGPLPSKHTNLVAQGRGLRAAIDAARKEAK